MNSERVLARILEMEEDWVTIFSYFWQWKEPFCSLSKIRDTKQTQIRSSTLHIQFRPTLSFQVTCPTLNRKFVRIPQTLLLDSVVRT